MKSDPLDRVARWAAAAREEPAPQIDVSDRVTRALRSQRRRRPPVGPDPTLAWFATASAVAASAATLAAIVLYLRIADPLWTLFASIGVYAP